MGTARDGFEIFLINVDAGHTIRIRNSSGELSPYPSPFAALEFSGVRFQADVRPLSRQAVLLIVTDESEVKSVQKVDPYEADNRDSLTKAPLIQR
jgi:hypothetical protein